MSEHDVSFLSHAPCAVQSILLAEPQLSEEMAEDALHVSAKVEPHCNLICSTS